MQSLQLSEGGATYKLLVELGSGGMAEVFLAFVEGRGGLSKLQVVKRLKASLAHDTDFVRMFLDEARLGARLNHPNVVQTHEIGEHEGSHFLVMEYLDGQPLSRLRTQHLRKMGRPLPIETNLRILTEVLRGLEYAHNLADFDGTPLAVVHRDVSPQNVFITYDGVVKIVDFGVAKAAMNSVETRTGVMKGKLTYMAPEQVRASVALDRRADIFSVGVLLHEAIVGERMWRGVPDVTIMSHLLEGRIPGLPASSPADLKEACERAMALAPNQRFPTAGLFNLALEEAIRHLPVVSQEELSALVRGLFHDEREKAQITIDAQLRKACALSKEESGLRASLTPRPGSVYPPVDGLPPPRLSDPDGLRIPEASGVPPRGQGAFGPLLAIAALAIAGAALVIALKKSPEGSAPVSIDSAPVTTAPTALLTPVASNPAITAPSTTTPDNAFPQASATTAPSTSTATQVPSASPLKVAGKRLPTPRPSQPASSLDIPPSEKALARVSPSAKLKDKAKPPPPEGPDEAIRLER